MPPLSGRSAGSLPTLVSLGKLLHLIPAAIKSRHAKRGAEWAINAASMALEEGEGEEEPAPELMFKLILSVGLVLLGGVFAG